MEDWNPEDYQGRRKEQYESSARILFYCYIAMAALMIGCLIFM